MNSAPTLSSSSSTPLPVIATVSRIVTKVVDQITGDRSDYPLLVASACVEALKIFEIESRVMFGPSAWIEVMEDFSVHWAGCWGENFSFWVTTPFGEVVDLNTSVAVRKRAHTLQYLKALYSPPILWSAEVPVFYRYLPEGVAELELTEERDQKQFEAVRSLVTEKCKIHLGKLAENSAHELEFPNEAIICPSRQLLDDSNQTFKHFDRAISVHGIPPSPF